jgi:hypothetical protein
MRWAREWAKEAMSMDLKELCCPRRAPGHCVAAEVGGREDLFLVGTALHQKSLGNATP